MSQRILCLAAAVMFSLSQADAAAPFTLEAAQFHPGGVLPDAQVLDGFGCHGGNRSPALSWSAPPQGTRSFAVTLYDPDSPSGSGWWHWTVFNLPPDTRALPEGAASSARLLPSGAVQGRTDFGTSAYGGACPPSGDKPHRYIFTVWALDAQKLPLDAGASGAMVGFVIHQHAIGAARLAVLYGR